jgi:hypothetical protein
VILSRADAGRLRDGLQRLARQADAGAAGFRLFLYLCISLPPAMAFVHYLVQESSGAMLPYLFVSPLLTLIALYYNLRLRDETRRALESSGLLSFIAMDGLSDDDIFNQFPLPWRSLLVRDSPGSALPSLRRLAGNLDWYLRRQVRQVILDRWGLLLSYGLLLLAIHSVIRTFWEGGGNFGDLPWWGSALVALLIALVIVFRHFKRQVWTEELVAHLKAALDD